MTEQSKVLFVCEDRPVRRGDRLHVAPAYHSRAGAAITAEREAADGFALCRSLNGAVPTLPIAALSWQPHPETQDREQIAKQRPYTRITDRDVHVWRLGRDAEAARLRAVLNLVGTQCENYRAPATCWSEGRVVGAAYGADAVCPHCIAARALVEPGWPAMAPAEARRESSEVRASNEPRDPRVDPRPGDVLHADGRQVTVLTVESSRHGQRVRVSDTLNSGGSACGLSVFRRLYKKSVVVSRGAA